MRLPKVSVLVPAYNEEKYIGRILTALAGQDYPEFEVIVADNASTDDTAAIVQKFIETTPCNIRFVHESRQGTNYARECARLHATGSIIAQADADCIPAKDWLRKGVQKMLNKSTVAATGPYDYFDGGFLMRRFSLLSQQLLYPLTNQLAQLSGRAAIIIGGNAFIRADVLAAAGGYDTAFTFYGDDVALAKRLAKYGYVSFSASLVQPTSSRRYQVQGFWKVNRKYQACFWKLLRGQELFSATLETSHPR